MILLILAAVLWVFVHIGVSGTALRDALVARVGERVFSVGFSVASVGAIVLLVQAWQGAGTTPLWFAPAWLRWILAIVMLPAFVLFACSLIGNPTAMGGAALLAQGPRGIQRVTRHPMLNAFAIWAAVHVLGNGDSAAVVFFGAFLVTAVAGMPSIDAKMAKRHPDAWPGFAAASSIIPGAAILAGRNRLVVREIGWVAPLIGLVAWAGFLHAHRHVFGVPALILG
ncbi:NnrU family protein [Roseomonas fluvialis]|uniref:Denitrification regulatory protein n=1 Tax=Roseomonas fluvialis TaxID=1750527 RepID=A0ABN6P618_9PROT|nr:NnrU family protein [Roseomonas fluvialis]BDG74122.1 denitrification regulatory protein [Roseomonas fluvialis]